MGGVLADVPGAGQHAVFRSGGGDMDVGQLPGGLSSGDGIDCAAGGVSGADQHCGGAGHGGEPIWDGAFLRGSDQPDGGVQGGCGGGLRASSGGVLDFARDVASGRLGFSGIGELAAEALRRIGAKQRRVAASAYAEHPHGRSKEAD